MPMIQFYRVTYKLPESPTKQEINSILHIIRARSLPFIISLLKNYFMDYISHVLRSWENDHSLYLSQMNP